jgi:hypothetical protein
VEAATLPSTGVMTATEPTTVAGIAISDESMATAANPTVGD